MTTFTSIIFIFDVIIIDKVKQVHTLSHRKLSMFRIEVTKNKKIKRCALKKRCVRQRETNNFFYMATNNQESQEIDLY